MRSALISLTPESAILSLCRTVEPGAVVARMLEGVELDRNETWRLITEATLEGLQDSRIYERVFYLALRLPDEGAKEGLRSVLGSAATQLTDAFGSLRHPSARARSRLGCARPDTSRPGCAGRSRYRR
jgi:hypothetical protein